VTLISESRQTRNRPWAAVARLGGCGDNLIVSSVLPLLAQKYNVEVIAQDPFHVVFENNPYVSKLTVKKSEDFPEGALEWQQWFVKRGQEYAAFFNLSHSCETSLALLRGQTHFYWPAQFRRQWCGRSYLEFVHDIVGVPHEFNPRFYPTDEEREQARGVINVVGQRHIGWLISGTRLDKIYPQTPMVIARLIKELNVPVIMFGAPGRDFEMAKQIQDHVKKQNGSDHGLHLGLSPDYEKAPAEMRQKLKLQPGKPSWPLRRVLTQLKYCSLVIGPDTGPQWALAMEPVPQIVLLSHASEENITKHWKNTITLHADPKRVPCWPCHQLHDDPSTCTPNAENNGAACISDISAETILTTARDILAT
jgi:ADP-heptose:LPS heptosyltransferase